MNRAERVTMLTAIHNVWSRCRDNAALVALWSLSDGYGEPGYVPEQGYDWSGIRDSSDDAVRAMFAAVNA